MRTRDGRSIGVLEVGQAAGVPVFHFHGSGSSRLEAVLVADAAKKAGVRLIALDRPGVGQSDPCDRDRLLDWPEQVVEVADALKIQKFAVLGMSAGGPYALACAAAIPHRLTACALICAVAPPELIRRAAPLWMRLIWHSAQRFPDHLRRLSAYGRPEPAAKRRRRRKLDPLVDAVDGARGPCGAASSWHSCRLGACNRRKPAARRRGNPAGSHDRGPLLGICD
jgi:pimeloyl-ACP methyl ester carboxylesterase